MLAFHKFHLYFLTHRYLSSQLTQSSTILFVLYFILGSSHTVNQRIVVWTGSYQPIDGLAGDPGPWVVVDAAVQGEVASCVEMHFGPVLFVVVLLEL